MLIQKCLNILLKIWMTLLMTLIQPSLHKGNNMKIIKHNRKINLPRLSNYLLTKMETFGVMWRLKSFILQHKIKISLTRDFRKWRNFKKSNNRNSNINKNNNSLIKLRGLTTTATRPLSRWTLIEAITKFPTSIHFTTLLIKTITIMDQVSS